MNLYTMLQARAERGMPLRVGLIGAGKFGAMFLSQALHTPGLHVLAIADLNVARTHEQLASVGWPTEQYRATSAAKALATGATYITDDAEEVINAGGIEVIIEATGVPEAGIRHALKCFERGRHVVMVNVEADALAGPPVGPPRGGGQRRLFDGLRRSTGVDCRTGRLGTGLRFSGYFRWQGNQVPA